MKILKIFNKLGLNKHEDYIKEEFRKQKKRLSKVSDEDLIKEALITKAKMQKAEKETNSKIMKFILNKYINKINKELSKLRA